MKLIASDLRQALHKRIKIVAVLRDARSKLHMLAREFEKDGLTKFPNRR